MFPRGRSFGFGGAALLLGLAVAPPARAEPGEVVLRGHEGAVFAAQLTPDGERAVTAATDGTVRLWDATTGAELRRFAGHSGPVTGVAISGDGRTLATSSQDNTVRVWDLPLVRPLLSPAGKFRSPTVRSRFSEIHDVHQSPPISVPAFPGCPGIGWHGVTRGVGRPR